MIDKNLKILILGASGFVGKNLLLKISNQKNWVVYAGYNKNPIKINKDNIIPIKINFLSKKVTLEKILNKIDVVVNLAGNVTRSGITYSEEIKSLKKTVDINLNIITELGKINSLPKIIHISSVTGYPSFENRHNTQTMFKDNPPNKWFIKGWTYRYIEKMYEYCLQQNYISSLKILRPSMIYGPFEKIDKKKFIPILINNKIKKDFKIVSNHDEKKNIIFVDDLCDDILKMINCNKRFTVVYCKNNTEIPVKLIHETCNYIIKNKLYELEEREIYKYVKKEKLNFTINLDTKKMYNLINGMNKTIKWQYSLNKESSYHE